MLKKFQELPEEKSQKEQELKSQMIEEIPLSYSNLSRETLNKLFKFK